jgi:hypothetical protein
MARGKVRDQSLIAFPDLFANLVPQSPNKNERTKNTFVKNED